MFERRLNQGIQSLFDVVAESFIGAIVDDSTHRTTLKTEDATQAINGQRFHFHVGQTLLLKRKAAEFFNKIGMFGLST